MEKRRRTVLVAGVILLILSIAAVCTFGRYPLSANEILGIITGRIDGIPEGVFFKIRLPRVLFSTFSGAVLALCGFAYQELFSNPLASPDVLGASGGASVGAALAIAFGYGSFYVQISALAFSLFSVALTVILATLIGKTRAFSLVLSGIVVKAICDASLMALKYTVDSEGALAAIEYRLMGSFRDVRNIHLLQVISIALPMVTILYLLRWRIRLLTLGDEEAEAMGIPAGKLRIFCIAAATIPAAAVVAVTGIVSWIGLIVPHTVRIFVKGDFKDNFFICAVYGAVFTVWTDTAARTLSTAEIPVSILTSLAGAVFLFAVLIFRKNRRGDDV